MADESNETIAKQLDTGFSGLLKKITTSSSAGGMTTGLFTLASSLAAVVIALGICAVLLAVTGKDPWAAYTEIIKTGTQSNQLLEMMKRATPLMMAATAVAVGFKMNLFNIGVEGQYLFAALMASAIGTQLSLPAVLHVTVVLLLAMIAGAAWASIAATLKVTRGVHEVISTIMLNYIALSVIQWLFENWFRDNSLELNIKTKALPVSGRMPDIVENRLGGMFIVALFVVFLYWILVFKSRFGFRLRASGLNAGAATTSGIGAKKMIVIAMLISGGIAGLVAMQSVVGEIYGYGPNATPTQLGFAGITVALLGRHHPIGIVAAALLFGFLDSTSAQLQLAQIPSSIVKVIQAVIVLTVVIVNEASIRWLNKRTAEQTAARLVASDVTAGVSA